MELIFSVRHEYLMLRSHVFRRYKFKIKVEINVVVVCFHKRDRTILKLGHKITCVLYGEH